KFSVFKADVRDEIAWYLDDTDLNVTTRREVKEHLAARFGHEIVEGLGEFVEDCIEEFTLEKLALL
ncbi:hypothetical protein HK102_003852, partial [Quaeritorhiza haematococci]